MQVGWCGAHMPPNGMAIRRRARAAVSCSAHQGSSGRLSSTCARGVGLQSRVEVRVNLALVDTRTS